MTPAALAVIVTAADAVTGLVAIAKVVLVAPGATDTLAGTVADELLLVSDTVNPPEGAAADSVIVPCDDAPPVTDDGLTETLDNDADGGGGGGASDGVTVRLAVRDMPLAEPVMVVVRVV